MNDEHDDGPLPGPADEPSTDAVPHAEPMHRQDGLERLDRRVVPYWLMSGVVGLAVLAMPVAGAFVMFQDKLPFSAEVKFGLLIGGFAVALLIQLVAPPLAWRRWRFHVGSDLLVARYGIVFHEEKAIPISRLQHVDMTRGPIERLFGLATLVVHTAGTEAAAFRLPGLSIARATELRDRILEARGDDVV